MNSWVKKLRSWPVKFKIAATAIAAAVVVIMVVVTPHWIEEYTEPSRMPGRFDVVEPGKLYRSGQFDSDEMRNVCRKYQIRTILLLRAEEYPEETTEYRVAERIGVKIIRVGISSKDLPDQKLAELRRVFQDANNYPILAHCEYGVARTGVAVALWRIEQQGWSGERAVQEMIGHGYPVRGQSDEIRERLRTWGTPKTTSG